MAPKPGCVVAGLVLLLDGIGLSAFCLAADRLGLGEGYGIGPGQILGVVAGILLCIAGLAVLLREARRGRPGNPSEEKRNP